jgi:hypothetical protein
MVILLILVVVWAVVLGPSFLRRRAARRGDDSIGAFHRQLRVLEPAGPSLVDPANRLDVARAGHAVSGAGHHLRDVRHDRFFRPEACRRRREVLMVLVGIAAGTGLLGLVPPLRPILVLTVVAVVVLAAYIALLVHLRTLALEREAKLRYLPQASRPEPAFVVRRAAVR